MKFYIKLGSIILIVIFYFICFNVIDILFDLAIYQKSLITWFNELTAFHIISRAVIAVGIYVYSSYRKREPENVSN